MNKQTLKHIVFIKVLEEDTAIKDQNLSELKNRLETLPQFIEDIQHLEVGINFSTRQSAFDLSLYVHLADEDALNRYRVHPEHIKVLDFMKSLNLQTAVVDYYM